MLGLYVKLLVYVLLAVVCFMLGMAVAPTIITHAQAQADANRIVAESLTEELISYEDVYCWDGVLPRFTGGGTVSFVNVDSGNSSK